MKRKSLLTGIFFLALGWLSVGVFFAMPPTDRPGVTKANFDRIEVGMTKAEVEAMFGKECSRLSSKLAGLAIWSNETWRADNGAEATIGFEMEFGRDEVERVSSMSWQESSETPVQRVYRLLRLWI